MLPENFKNKGKVLFLCTLSLGLILSHFTSCFQMPVLCFQLHAELWKGGQFVSLPESLISQMDLPLHSINVDDSRPECGGGTVGVLSGETVLGLRKFTNSRRR